MGKLNRLAIDILKYLRYEAECSVMNDCDTSVCDEELYDRFASFDVDNEELDTKDVDDALLALQEAGLVTKSVATYTYWEAVGLTIVKKWDVTEVEVMQMRSD